MIREMQIRTTQSDQLTPVAERGACPAPHPPSSDLPQGSRHAITLSPVGEEGSPNSLALRVGPWSWPGRLAHSFTLDT